MCAHAEIEEGESKTLGIAEAKKVIVLMGNA
jgi:hypothetical protein